MVSFSCEACNETMIKKKVAGHIGRCRASVTCIDCSNTFPGQTFKSHNQCMTEDQKYQGKLYKPKAPAATPGATPGATPAVKLEQKQETKQEPTKSTKSTKKKTTKEKVAGPVKVAKPSSLKKVLKQLRKEHKLDKKQILDKVSVDTNGQLVLTL